VVTASSDKTARLWDARDGKPLATLEGHTERVVAVWVHIHHRQGHAAVFTVAL